MAATALSASSKFWRIALPARPRGPVRRRAVAWSASIALHGAVLWPWLWLWTPSVPEVVRVPEAAPVAIGLVTWTAPAPPAPQPLAAAPATVAPLPPTVTTETVETPTLAATPLPVERAEAESIAAATPTPARVPTPIDATLPSPPALAETASPAAAAATPASPARSKPVATADEIAVYVSRVRGLIDDRKHYPRQARRRAVEGTVLMRLLLTSSGRVGEVDIVDAAHGLLEKATREAVDRVDAFPAPPRGVSWIEVAVHYDLDD